MEGITMIRHWLPLAGLLSVVVVAGCASTKHWSKPGATAAEFARDSFDCATKSREEKGGVNKDVYRACLQMFGYERRSDGQFKGIGD